MLGQSALLTVSLGQIGRIESPFGQTGKFKVRFSSPLPSFGKVGDWPEIVLKFKRFLYQPEGSRRVVQ